MYNIGMKKYGPIILIIAIFGTAYLISKPLFYQANVSESAKHDSITVLAQGVSSQASSAQIQNSSAPKVQAINGVMVDPNLAQRPFAVVVENHPDSRPQSGLSQADIVYEALAEGGITRFLAVFQTQNVKNIGPVRSARTYFNDWAQELGAVYAHVGGNSDALANLAQGIPGISNADQFFNDPYFWRITARKMPHNAYTSTDDLQKLAAAHRFSMAKSYVDYSFKDDQPSPKLAVSKINIDFSSSEFNVKYIYNPSTNSYKRYNAGLAAIDAGNSKQIEPKDIIVQIVRNWPVKSDTPLAISMATHDGGSAEVFLDGRDISGSWKYVDGRTKYFDQNGKEIALNRGQIFIEIVPPDFEKYISIK